MKPALALIWNPDLVTEASVLNAMRMLLALEVTICPW